MFPLLPDNAPLPATDLVLPSADPGRCRALARAFRCQPQIRVLTNCQAAEGLAGPERRQLLLFSVQRCDWAGWYTLSEHRRPPLRIALLDAPADPHWQLAALRHGASGVFAEGVSLHQLRRGIEQLLRGELWFPRAVLGHYLRQRLAH